MTQPEPAPTTLTPPNGPLYPGPDGIRDIELIHDIIMGEQPGTAVAIGDLWGAFAKALRDASASAQGTADSLFEWESDHAQPAYLERSDETVAKLEETAEVSDRVGEALHNLGQVMREGQDRMQDLYDEYKTAMVALDDAIMNGGAQAPDNVVYQYFGEYLNNMRTSPDGTLQGQFKELWDEKALALEREISSSYNEPYTRLFNIWYYAFPWLVPIEYVYHPSGEGVPVPPDPPGTPPPPLGAGTPAPPPAAPATPAPPTAALMMVAPLTAPPVTPLPPPPSSLPATALIGPPGTTALPAPSATPPPPVLPAGAVITPAGVAAPPAGVRTPPGGLVAPPAAATRPAGATLAAGSLPPGARTLGMTSPPPGHPATESASPPGAPDPAGPPGVALPDPGTPGAGATMPPGAGMGMPPGTGAPPGTGPAPPPQARAGQRTGPAATPPGGTATPATVPDAFLPPTAGLNPPVLGDPQRQQRTKPGGAAEAPRTSRAGPRPSAGGGGTPPILANQRLTGPRPTYTQRREADRLARYERLRQIRELLRSARTKDLPPATSPVLDGPAATPGAAGRRSPEVPQALRGAQPATGTGRPADRTARRPVPEPPATTWEVPTPGGPVVTHEQRRRQRPDREPRALGGGS